MAKRKPGQMAPEEALQFLEDMRTLASDIDEPTVAISIRIPANVLRAIKAKATLEKRKYQSLVVEFIRQGLKHP
ncbi:MAG: hypothetical protein EOP06_05765 [Proteobacteria bacterium]|nr:MAG: hypothetical protein EOP06_05765 [Pseudomonadota bacterium]